MKRVLPRRYERVDWQNGSWLMTYDYHCLNNECKLYGKLQRTEVQEGQPSSCEVCGSKDLDIHDNDPEIYHHSCGACGYSEFNSNDDGSFVCKCGDDD